jgi:hypothetical protein
MFHFISYFFYYVCEKYRYLMLHMVYTIFQEWRENQLKNDCIFQIHNKYLTFNMKINCHLESTLRIIVVTAYVWHKYLLKSVIKRVSRGQKKNFSLQYIIGIGFIDNLTKNQEYVCDFKSSTYQIFFMFFKVKILYSFFKTLNIG